MALEKYNEDGELLTRRCPVCGTLSFPENESYHCCMICGWMDEKYQEDNPDEDQLANEMSLNQARAAYKSGQSVR